MNIVLMCCPGREAMVAELRRALNGKNIVVEVWDAQREGAAVCALRAFEMGLGCFKGAPFTIIQDDAEVCAGFGAYGDTYMADVADKELVIQWYAHPWAVNGMRKAATIGRGFVGIQGGDFVCSIATTYCEKWARKILAHLKDAKDMIRGPVKDGETRTWDGRKPLHGDDALIAECLDWDHQIVWVHVPSLVQHVGVDSLVAPGIKLESHDARVSRCYVGKTFDARTLIDKVRRPWRKDMNMENAEKKVGEMTARELFDAMESERRRFNSANARPFVEGEGLTVPNLPDIDPADGRPLATEFAQDLPGLGKTFASEETLASDDAAVLAAVSTAKLSDVKLPPPSELAPCTICGGTDHEPRAHDLAKGA